MSERIKPLSIIAKMVVILLLPVLFFTYVGHDPMKEQETATRGIAIVNEDNGANYENKPVAFGKEVAASLDTNSAYDWFVVDRNTAEKGLEEKQYDAVIYLPSDFSRNIMTFNENEPIKAGVEYKIQTSLNAENIEKVQRELEVAKNNMNKQVSTLYWSHVSQAVDDIREKFDNILEKEIAFQKTMYDFYTPSSEKLAGEISQHKEMLESVFASSKDAGRSSSETVGEIEAAKADVHSFVEDVTRFKEYQEAQAEMFTMTSTDNLKLLQNGVADYGNVLDKGRRSVVEKQVDPRPEFDLDGGILSIDSEMDISNLNLNDFSDELNNVTGNQEQLIKDAKELNQDLATLIPEEESEEPVGRPELAAPGEISLGSLTQQLETLRTEVNAIKSELEPNPTEPPAEPPADGSQPVQQAQTVDQGKWEKILNDIDKLLGDVSVFDGGVRDEANKYEQNLSTYEEYIGELEQKLADQKTTLDEIKTKVADQDANLNLERYKENTGILKAKFDIMGSNISKVQSDFDTFSESLTAFEKEYQENVTKQQSEIQTELDLITEQASQVSANLVDKTEKPEVEPSPVDSLDGTMLVSVQDSTAGSLQGIAELVNSVGERQDEVTGYTNELQSRVGSVQQRADDLNNNWALNVNSTKLIKNDVYGVLNNTLVDDQQNGYVYDYLANPVQVNGDVLKENESYTPPIIMLVIILISGLLIGFFLHLYSQLAPMVHAALYALLNFIVGLIISMYGLNIYPLEDVQAVKWTVFTVLLLFLCSAIVRLGFFIGPFVGSILTIGLIAFYTMPLLDLIMPNFNIEHPIADVYLSIQYGDSSSFTLAAIILVIATMITAAIPYMRNRSLVKREMAHEA